MPCHNMNSNERPIFLLAFGYNLLEFDRIFMIGFDLICTHKLIWKFELIGNCLLNVNCEIFSIYINATNEFHGKQFHG